MSDQQRGPGPYRPPPRSGPAPYGYPSQPGYGPPPPRRPPRPRREPVALPVQAARVLAVLGLIANALWLLALIIWLVIWFGIAMLGLMWGPACTPSDPDVLGLFCSQTKWPALGIATAGVLVTGGVQSTAYPMLWRRGILVMPVLISYAILISTVTIALTYARAGLG